MRYPIFALVCFASIASVSATAQTGSASFFKDVKPILRKRCQGCHQPASQGGKLILTNYIAFKAGGSSGPCYVPGRPQDSAIMRYIVGDPPSMPKNQKPLKTEDVEMIRKWIAEGAKDDTPQIKDPIDSQHPPTYSTPPVLSAVAFSPNGEQIAVSGFREVLVHKSDGSQLVARLVGKSTRIESVAYSPDGKYLAVVGGSPAVFGEVQFWDAKTFTLVKSIEIGYDSLFGASFSPNGDHLAFGSAENSVRIISVPEGVQELKFDNHSDWIFQTAWTLENAKFAQAGKPGEVTNRVGVFQADQHILSTGRDKSIKLIVAKTGQFVDDINTFTSAYRCMARHPKADNVLVGGDDGVPRRYQIYRTKPRTMNQEDHNLLKEYEKFSGRVNTVAFRPDGSSFIAAGEGGEARIYDTESGKILIRLKDVGEGVFTSAYRPDGSGFALGGLDGMLRLYNSAGKLLKSFAPVPIRKARL